MQQTLFLFFPRNIHSIQNNIHSCSSVTLLLPVGRNGWDDTRERTCVKGKRLVANVTVMVFVFFSRN